MILVGQVMAMGYILYGWDGIPVIFVEALITFCRAFHSETLQLFYQMEMQLVMMLSHSTPVETAAECGWAASSWSRQSSVSTFRSRLLWLHQSTRCVTSSLYASSSLSCIRLTAVVSSAYLIMWFVWNPVLQSRVIGVKSRGLGEQPCEPAVVFLPTCTDRGLLVRKPNILGEDWDPAGPVCSPDAYCAECWAEVVKQDSVMGVFLQSPGSDAQDTAPSVEWSEP